MVVRRLPWLLIAGASVACAAVAHATSLPLSSAGIASGAAAVISCDADGVDFRYTVDDTGHVTSVTVAGIDAGCQGGTLRVTLTNGGVSVGDGSAILPAAGPWTGAHAVPVGPQPLSSSLTATYAAIEGP